VENPLTVPSSSGGTVKRAGDDGCGDEVEAEAGRAVGGGELPLKL
jgi:hypothetical protein